MSATKFSPYRLLLFHPCSRAVAPPDRRARAGKRSEAGGDASVEEVKGDDLLMQADGGSPEFASGSQASTSSITLPHRAAFKQPVSKV
jgi:hypothetical protein